MVMSFLWEGGVLRSSRRRTLEEGEGGGRGVDRGGEGGGLPAGYRDDCVCFTVYDDDGAAGGEEEFIAVVKE